MQFHMQLTHVSRIFELTIENHNTSLGKTIFIVRFPICGKMALVVNKITFKNMLKVK